MAMENTMEVPEKTENRTTMQSSDITPKYISEGICYRI
jgi:hypothetical protein